MEYFFSLFKIYSYISTLHKSLSDAILCSIVLRPMFSLQADFSRETVTNKYIIFMIRKSRVCMMQILI